MLMRINKWTLIFTAVANMTVIALAGETIENKHDFIPTKIATSENHTCLLSEKGQVKCWGRNFHGELGIESETSYGNAPGTMGPHLPLVNFGTNLVAKDLCVGMRSTCVATTDGRVKCWGGNDYGQLGQEHEGDVGRQENDMGDNLRFTNLGPRFKVKSVHCGSYAHCALSDTGALKCWGRGDYGELGPDISPKNSIGLLDFEMGDNLRPVALPISVKYVSIGALGACAASASEIYCWGSNSEGQAGIGSTNGRIYIQGNSEQPVKVKIEGDGVPVIIEGISSGYRHNCALYHLASNPTQQKVKCWGANYDGSLGIESTAKNMGRSTDTLSSKLPETQLALGQIIQLEAHDDFACALAKNGDTKCWGKNFSGTLGLGDGKPRGQRVDDMGNQLPRVELGLPAIGISTGTSTLSSCAILVNHEIKCWGFGRYGTLGYEDGLSRGFAKEDMGENLPYVRYK